MGLQDLSVARTSGTSFPQSSTTRIELLRAIARYGGGSGDPARMEMAAEALKEAVEDYNGVLWEFNRLIADITLIGLPTPATTYALTSPWRKSERAKLLDSSNVERETCEYFPFEEFLAVYADRSVTGDPPFIYTLQNPHEAGLVTVYPIPQNVTNRPKLRLYYFRPISYPNADTVKLNVPSWVEQGIKMLAIAIHMSQFKSTETGTLAMLFGRAQRKREQLELEHRRFEDFIGSAG